MERIWTPWRKEYIGAKRRGCFLCQVLKENRDSDNFILYRGKGAFVIMNRYPYNNGHLMVAPILHKRLEKLSPAEGREIFELITMSAEVLKRGLKCEGLNIGANLGRVAGAGVIGHFHIHIVPRWLGDTNFLPLIAETKTIAEYLEETYEKLLPFFAERREHGKTQRTQKGKRERRNFLRRRDRRKDAENAETPKNFCGLFSPSAASALKR